jgi:putative hydrolase of the HAD superfamily
MRFAALGFDLDGTLYPNFRLYVRLVPFLLTGHRLLWAMGRARTQLRQRGGYGGDFYEGQARLMGELLGERAERVRERTERLIYRGFERHFRKIRLFPHVRETFDAFRAAGIPLGLLSDFPPETKLDKLGIRDYWQVLGCSELSGRLKPDPLPFLDLAGRMGVSPERMLYLGNSAAYDVQGARRAGMKTALIRSRLSLRGRKKYPPGEAPDFVFYDYRQLRDYVLS